MCVRHTLTWHRHSTCIPELPWQQSAEWGERPVTSISKLCNAGEVLRNICDWKTSSPVFMAHVLSFFFYHSWLVLWVPWMGKKGLWQWDVTVGNTSDLTTTDMKHKTLVQQSSFYPHHLGNQNISWALPSLCNSPVKFWGQWCNSLGQWRHKDKAGHCSEQNGGSKTTSRYWTK